MAAVRIKSILDKEEEQNEELGIGCYCLDATYNDTTYIHLMLPINLMILGGI